MRTEASVTTISWIPSEAVRGTTRVPFDLGLTHYDSPPPDSIVPTIDALADLSADDCFRFANHLSAWIEVDDAGRITDYGQGGAGIVSKTRVHMAQGIRAVFDPFVLPELRPEPEIGPSWVRFRQTAGGRPGVPAPRVVRKWPFVQWQGPWVWTTLELTLHADGRVERRLVGATPFPRHWLYDTGGQLVAKSGLTEFGRWYRNAFGRYSPWHGIDSHVLMAEAESALERQLSIQMMHSPSAGPDIRRVEPGTVLMTEGELDDALMLVLDGIVDVSVDGHSLATLGPGAVLGERAGLEGGRRTATITTRTECTVAVTAPEVLAPTARDELRAGHQRELVGAGSAH